MWDTTSQDGTLYNVTAMKIQVAVVWVVAGYRRFGGPCWSPRGPGNLSTWHWTRNNTAG